MPEGCLWISVHQFSEHLRFTRNPSVEPVNSGATIHKADAADPINAYDSHHQLRWSNQQVGLYYDSWSRSPTTEQPLPLSPSATNFNPFRQTSCHTHAQMTVALVDRILVMSAVDRASRKLMKKTTGNQKLIVATGSRQRQITVWTSHTCHRLQRPIEHLTKTCSDI